MFKLAPVGLLLLFDNGTSNEILISTSLAISSVPDVIIKTNKILLKIDTITLLTGNIWNQTRYKPTITSKRNNYTLTELTSVVHIDEITFCEIYVRL